jgi:hypothetical protein
LVGWFSSLLLLQTQTQIQTQLQLGDSHMPAPVQHTSSVRPSVPN